MAGLSINSVVLTICAVAIGVVMIGSLLAPIANDVMIDLSKLSNGGSWSTMVGVVVVVSILGLIVVAINHFTKD